MRPALPGEARRACPPPVDLPDRDLSDREVTAGWGADRAALVACEARRAAAVAAIDAVDPPKSPP